MDGGAGSDLFRYEVGDGLSGIRDFEDGIDRIDLSNFGFTSMTQFTVSVWGTGARLDFNGSDGLLLHFVDPSDLDDSDFIFP